MNKEEKEIIKELERKSNLVATECEIFIERSELFTILSLIDKLQKENAKLRNTNEILYETGKQNAIQEILNENWVSKNKIRNKIKELEESKDKEEYIDEYGVRNIPVLNAFIDLKIEILKELLGDDE